MKKQFDLILYIDQQRAWSEDTFGSDARTIGITRHIEKELAEIRDAPKDLSEWIDVVILALDGAWRAGYTSAQIVDRLKHKQMINFARKWPRACEIDPDKPSEHIRDAGGKEGRYEQENCPALNNDNGRKLHR